MPQTKVTLFLQVMKSGQIVRFLFFRGYPIQKPYRTSINSFLTFWPWYHIFCFSQTFVLYHTPFYGILASKISFSKFFQIYLRLQPRMFPAFFVYFSNFLKKIKKSACNLPESKIYYASRLTRPVGQGVKTSPSHGENTSSILVLAALFSDEFNTYVKHTAYMASWSRG